MNVGLFHRGDNPAGIGEVIKMAREFKAMSQDALAAAIGVKQASVSRWEAGLSEPTSENRKALRHALGLLDDAPASPQPASEMPSHSNGFGPVSQPQPATPKRIRLEFNELVTVDQAHRICAILNEREP